MSARIHLFDTTLRDGAQTTGVDFSLADKIAIARHLDALGIDYVEGGYPGANPLDTEFFREKRTERARFTAFGMTKRAGRSAANDPGVAALLDAECDAICFVAKAWDYHVRVALEIEPEENLASIRESVAAAVARGREAMVDCEHFFDGFKANPDYALACARTAYEAGARWVVLCDTNGGTVPGEVSDIVARVAQIVPGENLGIHAHDDCGCAVANSLAAIEAGARQNPGDAERARRALRQRQPRHADRHAGPEAAFRRALRHRRLARGAGAAQPRCLGRSTNCSTRQPNRHAPYVGASAFATKAGIHASAVLKDPKT